MLRVTLALLLALVGVQASAAPDPVTDALGTRLQELESGQTVRVSGELIAADRLLPEFYRRRGLQPAWLSADLRAQLLDLVEASPSHGLDPSDYHADALRKFQADAYLDPASVADRDLLWSDALVRLVYHLHFGKTNPRDLYADWSFSRTLGGTDPVKALGALISSSNLREAVEGYAPRLPLYAYLRAALAQLQSIEKAGGWGSVPAGVTLKPGMHDVRVQALRERLAAGGDLRSAADSEPQLFDATLEAAVKQFQMRHGLDPDGAVGRSTLQALNVPVAQRIDQVRVNLERLRWVAQDLKRDYLLVDIAGFSARLYLEGEVAWSSRVVVGRRYRNTPAFRAVLRSIVLNPTWTVPPTVLREDIVPRVIADRSYLDAHHMHVVDGAGREIDSSMIDWRRYRNRTFPYRIVQDPGPTNPLGALKFDMPNRYRVYLHDTPAKQLFERTERAFSSGCIRLETPRELAVLLLDDPEQWSETALSAVIATGETRVLPMKRHVPVAALYLTAEGDQAGVTYFRPDLYGEDAQVAAALAAPFRFAPVDRPRLKQSGAAPRV